MADSSETKQIYKEYADYIERHFGEMKAAALRMKDDLEHSPLFYEGRLRSRPLAVPRIYSSKTIARFKDIVAQAYGIFSKVINEYLSCADYRVLFPFSEELDELILAPKGYDAPLPVARFDIFYNEESGDFHFCEINCDGSAGMNEERLQDEMMVHNPAHQEIIRKYNLETFELFDSFVDTFLEIYSTYRGRVGRPNVAIVDFLDKATIREFEEFERRFQKAGVCCEICDIRALKYAGGRIISGSGHVIDAIYRRAVTCDIMEHFNEVQPFVRAVKEGAVFIAGPMSTQIIHHKWLFHMLHHPRTGRFLSPGEREFIKEHVPYTVPFNDEWIDPDTVKRDKDAYIIKPPDGYGAKGIMAGIAYSADEWERKVNEAYGCGWLCQEFVPQYEFENYDFVGDNGSRKKYISMAGLFVYSGKLAGIFARSGLKGGLIDCTNNEKCQAVYVLKD